MDFSVISIPLVSTLLLLLLIGMGPKIALVPFLEKTKHMDPEHQREVGVRMVKYAVITALVLFAAGSFLMNLLHVSPGTVSIAGGIVLMLIALQMGSGHASGMDDETPIDRHQIAIYPLAVPYMLNPAGMVILIILSARAETWEMKGMIVGLILTIGAFDYLIFRNIDKLAKRLNPVTLVISEVVFGILLTALSVELILHGLNVIGIISATTHT
jgi:small neutral amino acid transporter SnatA (MarC family)